MTTRIAIFLSIVPFALLLASVGAFLLYVPLMTVAATTAVLLALVLTFTLGLVAGGRRIRITRLIRRTE